MTRQRRSGGALSRVLVLVLAASGCTGPHDGIVGDDTTEESQEPIINGTTATSDPIGLVFLDMWDYSEGSGWFCSGTLLTNKWVLTAKHCVADKYGVPLSPPSSEIWVYHALNVNSGNPPYVPANAVFVHPTLDIALIQLSGTFAGTNSVTNVLGLHSAQSLRGKTVSCYGYGYDTKRTGDQLQWGAPGILRYANTQKVTSDDGTTMYLDAVTQGEYHGDSGGPCFYTSGGYRYLVMVWTNWNYVEPNDWDPYNAFGPSAIAFRDWVWYWMFTGDGSLGGSFNYGPAIAASDAAHLQVFAPDSSGNSLKEDRWTASGWTGWGNLNRAFVSAPAAARRSATTSLVVARQSDNNFYWAIANINGAPPTWTSMGKVLTGSPAAVSTQDGSKYYTYVFGRGTDSKLYWRRFDGSTWNTWSAVAGGTIASDPSAASRAPGTVQVFSLASNGSLQYVSYQSGTWQWTNVGGSYVYPPAVTSSGPNQLDLFMRNSSNVITYRKWYGMWAPGWTSFDYVTTANPAAVSRAVGQIDLVFRGPGNDIRYAASGY